MAADYDVCVIGSGAGGGIVAYRLAMAGLRVAVLEKGPWYKSGDFSNDELKLGDRRFIDQDPRIEPRTFRDSEAQGARLMTDRVLPLTRCVGGGAVHYGAVSFRFRREDFRARSFYGHLPGADLVDWPLTDAELDNDNPDSIWAYYRKCEKLLGVAGGQMRDQASPGAPVPGAEWRSDPYPMPGHPPNYGAKLFEDGARSLGLNPYPTPVAINNGPYTLDDPDLLPDGRPLTRNGCAYCGFCSSHGCQIDAKGDTRVTALALAQRTGRCDILSDAHVFHVELKNGRGDHVVYYDAEGRTQALHADRFVMACSTVDTPRLALLSDFPDDLVNNDLVGRYLTVHHFPGAVGWFQDRIDYYRGFWSMRCLDDFYFGTLGDGVPQFGFGNIQTVGPSSGYPLLAGGVISAAKTLPWGAAHKTLMRNLFGHYQFVGMVAQDPPVAGNRVDLDPGVTDAWGLPVARVTYARHPNDYNVALQATVQLEAILLAMCAHTAKACAPSGSPTAIPQILPGDTLARGPLRGIPDPMGGLLNHQHGTMRMGFDPATSVVDENCRFHGIPNLYVGDGSVMPTCGGYNPTLTLQALAWRTADGIVRDAAEGV